MGNISSAGGVSTFGALTDVKVVVKSADETVNNSAVVQADDELLFAYTAGKHYHAVFTIRYTSSAVADFRCQFTANATCIIGTSAFYLGTDGTTVTVTNNYTATGSGTVIQCTGGAGTYQMVLEIDFYDPTNSDTLYFKWAQNTAEVSNTIVKAGSNMVVIKLD